MSFTLPRADGVVVIFCMKFDPRASVKDRLAFKESLKAHPEIEVSMDTIGHFDFMVEARMNGPIEYTDWLSKISGDLQAHVERYEAAILCSRSTAPRDPSYPAELWVSCADGQRRVDVDKVTYITAERDYMRLHLDNGESCLLHITAHKLLESLDPGVFVQIHRSTIVRRSCIERLLHQGRHWSVRMLDGENFSISKAHEADVVSTQFPHVERPAPLTEI